MTKKLYYENSFQKEFTATVLSCEPAKGGFLVVLDQTAFYPEGGGQPADHGTLNGVPVTDTREKEGTIFHSCSSPLPIGKNVTGLIDWERRFDLMQQHSGEHITSGMICSRYGCDNVGFHIGHDLVTIDFNAEISPEDLPSIEAAANAYIWSDIPVDIQFLSGKALEQAQYRSKKFIPGDVRLVAFPGADRCACCGTHVQRAGQVGLVKLLTCQKFRDGVRIEMAAGKRALDWCSAILAQNTKISQALSAKPTDTAAAVERLQQEIYTLRGRVMILEEGDFARKAESYAGLGDVTLFDNEMSTDSLRKLATAILDRCGGRCMVFSGSDESGYKYAVGEKDGDVRQLVKDMNSTLGGRGGGKPGFAQGTVTAPREKIEAYLATV